MERLTKRINGGVCHYDCTDTCSSCCGCECFDVWKMLDKLAAYEDTEEQGRLVVLPCKVGDTVYCIKDSCSVCQHLNDDGDYCGELARCGKNVYVENPFELSMLEKIGKTVFLTPEAAEAKLKEMEGNV